MAGKWCGQPEHGNDCTVGVTFPWPHAKSIECAFLARARPLDPDFPVLPRGVWTSEMFAFCTWAKQCNVDVIVESGVYLGQSTRVMDRFFPADVRIISIEREWRVALTSLCRDRWWGVIDGDAATMIPHVVPSIFTSRTIALLIDGPKGEPAIRLALDMLSRYPNVAFAAIHDLYRPVPPRENSARTVLDALPNPTWATDDPVFVERFRYLDGENHAKWLDETGHGRMPYRCLSREGEFALESYGNTLGFIFH